MSMVVNAEVNGAPVEFLCQPDDTLLRVLRDELLLTGTKDGCSTGDCGACTVLLDSMHVCACLVLAPEVEGHYVETIEGLGTGRELNALQRQFLELGALQCGVCTPGFLVAAKALLAESPLPSEDEVRYWLAGNLCRCTGYDKIVRAVLAAADEAAGDRSHMGDEAR
jgi:carbon-monoxide dehydrogenase small subunit